MKGKKKNLELKIYELLGVKKFRNILINLLYILCYPLFLLVRIPKEERKKIFYSSSSNYFMKKGNGLQDLKDFKKMLYFNSGVHIVALILSSTICFTGTITNIFFIILNSYCILLQRYNYIRINEVIKKHEKYEEKKIENIKVELKEKDSLLKDYTYEFGLLGKEIKEITIDELLENASLERLKQIKIILEDISNKEKTYEKYPNLIYSSTIFEEKKKNYCLKISRNKQ